uniref:ATP synthase complex subunit 8 n=1 Tax=Penelopides panini TaxID=175834 RepID=E9NYZ5_PENPI|nr:ATP synthase F0 subunit 8 [Penelopides panini]ADW41486.1 ATP synthase F0 subunit 8 [Penelopides panini]
MPQLNPNPWFPIMLASWLVYSLIIQPKLLAFLTTNPPNKMNPPTKIPSWPWPWS